MKNRGLNIIGIGIVLGLIPRPARPDSRGFPDAVMI